jgi:hypothetical protein
MLRLLPAELAESRLAGAPEWPLLNYVSWLASPTCIGDLNSDDDNRAATILANDSKPTDDPDTVNGSSSEDSATRRKDTSSVG